VFERTSSQERKTGRTGKKSEKRLDDFSFPKKEA